MAATPATRSSIASDYSYDVTPVQPAYDEDEALRIALEASEEERVMDHIARTLESTELTHDSTDLPATDPNIKKKLPVVKK